jgi:uncharacterized protein YbaR (Trm112 family)
VLSDRASLNCPACSLPMSRQEFERNYGTVVPVDICHPCGTLWFDKWEDLMLSPGAVLRLFVVINEKQPAQRNPLGTNLACPRCHARLVLTRDMQRNTRFQYWRCPAEHGHFITFFQFLREKNFVRPLDAAEVERLRQNVRSVTCSSCGAPVDLNVGSVCSYCRAPLSMLDARQVDTVVQELKREQARRDEADRGPVDPTLFARLARDRATVEDSFARLGDVPFSPDFSGSSGLVEAGLAALVDLLKRIG